VSEKEKQPLVKASSRPEEQTFSHPLNPESEMRAVSLSDAAGLRRIGVHLIRLAPGRESCIYHSHACEEEFLYILAGRGVAEIDGAEHEVGPGDFMGFPTPSVAHHLRNPFDEELVYLVGGERKEVEVGEFPGLGQHVLRVGTRAHLVATDDLKAFWPPEE
jgi:uncharacterized cupin superfamily protein